MAPSPANSRRKCGCSSPAIVDRLEQHEAESKKRCSSRDFAGPKVLVQAQMLVELLQVVRIA